MKKIKLGIRYPHGACSYYRSMGVFSKLHKLDANIDSTLIDKIDWHFIADADILYLERPQDGHFYNACKIAKDFNVKVWVDYDDDLFNIPSWNPAKPHYSKPEVKKEIKKCLKIADVVTVTTPALKRLYSKYNKNVHIVENAFNDYNYRLPNKVSKNKIVNWRGSNTHRGDLILYSHQMSALSEKYKEKWGWSFIGSDIWYIIEYMKSVFHVDEMSITKYWKYIKRVAPSIQISPLMLNQFNTGKSNISWIEGTYSRACHLGPHLTEFRKPGIETYKTPDEFGSKLDILINDEKLREQNFNASKEYIIDNLMLSDVNKKRIEIIEELAG